MANAKNKKGAKKDSTHLPEHFGSLEQAAEFWDANDSAPYEEHMSDVDCEVDVRGRAYLISLDGPLYRKVRAIARREGVAANALVNRWIEEKAS